MWFRNKVDINFMPWYDFDNFTKNRTHHPRRCFLRIWIASMCHFVNYANLWYEWRNNKVNIIWIWTHSSKIEHNHVKIYSSKIAHSYYLFSFMQFLKCTNKHNIRILLSANLGINMLSTCQMILYPCDHKITFTALNQKCIWINLNWMQ